MSKRISYLVGSVVGAATLLALTTLPASAESVTTVSFALTAGSLTVAQAIEPSTLHASGSTSISARLGQVAVNDARGGTLGWTASATSSGFARMTDGAVSTAVIYHPGAIDTTGIVTTATQGPTDLSADAVPVVVASAVSGNNTASWTPTVSVILPPNGHTGHYTGTVNVSVL